jgi:PhnB protein
MIKSKSRVPKGYQAVMPYLRLRDAATAIRFYKKVFGATESYRLKMAGKVGHAELVIGGSVVMLSDEFPDTKAIGPKSLKGTSVQLAVYVEDVDKVMAKAVKAGAKVVRAASDQFYGDRSGQIEDPFGHVWSIQSRIEKVAPKEMQKRLNQMMRSPGAAAGSRASAARKSARKAAPRKKAAAKRRVTGRTTARRASTGRKAARSASTTSSRRVATRKAAPKKPRISRTSAKRTPAKAAAAAKRMPTLRSTARKPVGSRRKAGSGRRRTR